MPRLFNVDHQHAILDADTSVAPGAPHDFTDEEAERLTGSWADEDPRAGLADEEEFKRLRDASRSDLDDEARALGIDPSGMKNRQQVREAITAVRAAQNTETDATSPPSPDDETPEEPSEGETTDPAEPGEDKE